MLDYFKDLHSSVLYIQIWENRLLVRDIKSSEYFDEKPLIAITRNSNNKKIISAVGNKAVGMEDAVTQVTNPFSHPRMLVGDFVLATKILQHVLLNIPGKKLFRPSPIVVIHPMDKVEGGQSEVEIRILKELAMGAGARKAYVYLGAPLSTANFDLELVARENGDSPFNERGKSWSSWLFVILLFALWYWYN
ncbi:MAG: rod shape-determining protein MreB [Pseudomonadota bacterium]